MAYTEHYYTKLTGGNFYHVYNRAVDRKPLFTRKRNYAFFLTRMVKYLIPVLDVYAFCLLRNHFHLLVKIKDFTTLQDLAAFEDLLNLVPNAFKKMFQSYAMAFNKQENRIGALFQEPFKRSLIDSEEYLIQMVYYIHFNPQKHGLVKNFRNYQHSSYPLYVQKTEFHWVQEELYKLFGGYEGFIEFHKNIHEDPDNKYLIENE